MHTRTLALQIQQPFPPRDPCAFFRFPPTIRLPARPPCPSRFVPSAASPCAPSRTTWASSRAKARSGISSVPAGDSQETCPCGQGKPSRFSVTLPNEQRIEVPEAVVRWSSGQEFAVENVVI